MLFIIGKYVKNRFKNRGSPCYFLEVKRSKILRKLNKGYCFCLQSWLHFLWRFSRKFLGLISKKTEALYAELNKRAEAATSSYSVTGEFLQYIYSVPVTKYHQNIRSRCLVHEFSFTDTF